jgi:hypothetical protein
VKSALSNRRKRNPLPARKARRAEPRGNGPTVDERLAHIAAQVHAGKHVELSWELFRLNCFPGWPHERVATALGLWSTRQGIKVSFEARDIRAAPSSPRFAFASPLRPEILRPAQHTAIPV